MSTSFSLRAKLSLVAFGLLFGVGLGAVVLQLLPTSPTGSEFENIDDLRRAMLAPEGVGQDTETGVSLGRLVMPHPDDRIIYDLRPHLDVKFQRARVRTNSCGMRGPEFARPKPPNTYRIALLGDSFAFGWGVEEHESFASVLQQTLQRSAASGVTIEVLNFGVPGYSTFQEVFQFIEKGAAFDPDAILVFFVQNDFGPPFFLRNLKSPGNLVASADIARLAMRAVDPNAQERQMLELGWDPNSSLKVLADWASERGVPLWFTINPRKTWKREHAKLWMLRKRRDIRFMNLRRSFMEVVNRRAIPTEALTLSWDPHPSPLRHRIYGEIMAPYFLPRIQ